MVLGPKRYANNILNFFDGLVTTMAFIDLSNHNIIVI